jgi:putative FmdB family regulatory protein
MPLYEYQCSKCDKIFEVIEKFADAPLTVHEGCGGRVERLLSAPSLQFKGSGWYVNDYPKSGSGKKGDTGSNGASESRGGESKGGESKSGESKSESKAPASGGKTESKPAASTTKKD